MAALFSRKSSSRRSSSRRSSSHRSSSRHSSSHRHKTEERTQPTLFVDLRHPNPAAIWNVLGVLVVGVMSLFILRNPTSVNALYAAAAGLAIILGGIFTRSLPVPRWHPSLPWAVLLGLTPIAFGLMRGEGVVEAVADPMVYAVLVGVLIVWLVRTRSAILTAAAGWVVLLEIYITIRMRHEDMEYPAMLRSFPPPDSIVDLASPPRNGTEAIVLLVLLVACVVAMVLQYRVDRKRWPKEKSLRIIMGLSMGVTVLVLLLGVAAPELLEEDEGPLLAVAFGLTLAARERMIHNDETRHPRRHRTPLSGFLEEGRVAAGALVAGVRREPGIQPPRPRSAVIDPASKVLYNPYANETPRWVPVVMHMHSNEWEGTFNADTVVGHYHRIGAKSVILTDHNRITTSKNPFQNIPAYEHGWGPHHHHVLVLNARRRLTERHPFGSNHQQKAATLARLRDVSDVLILAHPRHRNAWSSDDVSHLDYDAVEIFNKSIDSFRRWDEALSTNRMVWGAAGDDCHDLRSRHQTGKRYMLVDLGDATPDAGYPADPEAVLAAIRAGRFLSVRYKGRNVTRQLPGEFPWPERFSVEDGRLRIKFASEVDQVKVYGSFRTKKYQALRIRELDIAPVENEGYIRVVCEHASEIVSFNPVVRISPESTPPDERGLIQLA